MIQAAHEGWARRGERELLLEYVRCLETARDGRRAVHVSLSGLPPARRRPRHLDAATAGLAALAERAGGHLFTVDGTDVIFVYESGAQMEVETAIETLRKLLGVTGDGLETWFDLETSYAAFVERVRSVSQPVDRVADAVPEPVPAAKGSSPAERNDDLATPETLSRVSAALQNADLSNLLRRQAVYALGRHMCPRPLFREFYFSIPDVGEALLPRGDLLANGTLFRHATKALDRVMLSSLTRNGHEDADHGVSINLNLSTVLSDAFALFDESMNEAGRSATIIEIQCADIVSETKAYARVRAYLRERGYRICVDGVTPPALDGIGRLCPDVDFIKMHWDPAWIGAADKKRVDILTEPPAGPRPRLVISRAGTPDALAFGQSLGIELFQGRYIDAFAERDRRWRQLVRLNRGFQAGG